MNNQIWRSCPKGEQHRNISKFMHMRPEQLATLNISELSLLFQWVFEIREIETAQAIIQEDYFDLEVVDKKAGKCQEYVRVYRAQPISAVYHLTAELKGRDVKKIYLFTFDKFPIADKNARDQSPLFLELREFKDTIRFILESRAKYRKKIMLNKK